MNKIEILGFLSCLCVAGLFIYAWQTEEINRKKKLFFFIGIGIFCAVIGLQLGLHNSDIRKLKNEVKELRSENEAFKFCFKKLGFVIGFEESESREEK